MNQMLNFILKCMIDAIPKREEILARKAKANLAIAGKLGGESKAKGSAKLPKASRIDTRAACAKAAGVGERTL